MALKTALKTFRGRYGMIRTGTTFHPDPGYARKLEQKGWIRDATDAEKKGASPAPAKPEPGPGPKKDRAKPGAPNQAGKAQGGTPDALPPNSVATGTSKSTGRRRAGGAGVTSRSLRADLPSAAKTSSESASGAANRSSSGKTENDPPPDA